MNIGNFEQVRLPKDKIWRSTDKGWVLKIDHISDDIMRHLDIKKHLDNCNLVFTVEGGLDFLTPR